MTIVDRPVPTSYGSLTPSDEFNPSISDEERDVLQTVRPGYGSRGILPTSFNLVNATVGSGILGVPFALSCGGFLGGMTISVFVGFLTAVSLMMMIRAGIKSNTYKFAQLSELALGRSGYHLLNLFVFIQAAGSCISYFISKSYCYFWNVKRVCDPDCLSFKKSLVIQYQSCLVNYGQIQPCWPTDSLLLSYCR
jgi:hypothetical protein